VTPLQRKSQRKTDEDRLLALAAATTAAAAVGVEGEGVRGGGGGGAGEDDVCVPYSRFLLIFASSVPLRVPGVLAIFTNDGSPSVKHDSEVLEHQQHYHQYQQPRINKNAANTNIFMPITRRNKRVPANARKRPTEEMKTKHQRRVVTFELDSKEGSQIGIQQQFSFSTRVMRASWTDCEHLFKCFIISIINLYHI